MRIRLEAEAVLYIQEKIATHEIELAWFLGFVKQKIS
jgi:hypothetical protein